MTTAAARPAVVQERAAEIGCWMRKVRIDFISPANPDVSAAIVDRNEQGPLRSQTVSKGQAEEEEEEEDSDEEDEAFDEDEDQEDEEDLDQDLDPERVEGEEDTDVEDDGTNDDPLEKSSARKKGRGLRLYILNGKYKP